MRGLWDNEQPLSPRRLRWALALLAGFLVVLAGVNVLLGVGALVAGRIGSALVQFSGGLAIPFAIWLALRVLADMLILQHRSLDRANPVTGADIAASGSGPAPAAKPAIADTAASDDGPAYPEED